MNTIVVCTRADKLEPEASGPIGPDGLHLHIPLTLLHIYQQIQAVDLREPHIALGGQC